MSMQVYRRLSIGALVAIGFAMGVVVVASCGGSSQSSAHAGGVQRHVATGPAQSVSSSNVLSTTLFSTTFTPGDPSDILLRVSAYGTWSTPAGQSPITVQLSVANSTNNHNFAFPSATLTAANSGQFRIATALEMSLGSVGSGAPDGIYNIRVAAFNGDPAGSAVDFGIVTVEIETISGVTVLTL